MVSKDRFVHMSDNELLEKFQSEGNSEWLGILLQRYTLLLLGTCMKYLKNEEEAKDSVQQIFLKAITELPKYKIAFFKSWLYMVARNHCLMLLRNKNAFMPVDENTPLAAREEDKKDRRHTEKTLTFIESSIKELNEEQKNCVTQFYLEKKSYTEIAAHTHYTVKQVKSHIQNGKRNLKILVEKKMKEQ